MYDFYLSLFNLSNATTYIETGRFNTRKMYKCKLKLLDFFQDVTWNLTLDFAPIWP